LRGGGAEDILELLVHLVTQAVESAGNVYKSAAVVATFWLSLAKVGICGFV
jgi:hypothetical protein